MTRAIKADILAALMNRALQAKDEIKDINDEFGEDRSEAVDQHGLHTGAFALCVRLKRMEQVKRIDFLNAFDQYRDTLKLDDAPQIEAFEEHRARA